MNWWPDWRGEACAIVASGPSAKNAGVDLLRNRIRVVAINDSYRLCPWADVLYGCDATWWRVKDGVPEFQGLKITQDTAAVAKYPDIHKVTLKDLKHDALVWDERGVIGAGGNSGFQAFNLVVQFGAVDIALVGFDMRVDNGLHWHGRHLPPLHNPDFQNVARWVRAFNGATESLLLRRVSVVNCSMESAVECFPKMKVEEVLKRWGL